MFGMRYGISAFTKLLVVVHGTGSRGQPLASAPGRTLIEGAGCAFGHALGELVGGGWVPGGDSHPVFGAHADPHVTVEAEALLLMAARALRIVLPRRNRVHRDPVVRVNRARAHLPVVAVGTEPFGVAVGAEPAVVGGHSLVALDEVRRVR